MMRTVVKTLAMARVGSLLSTTRAAAAMTKGTVTAVDEAGMATVKAEVGQEWKVRGEGGREGRLRNQRSKAEYQATP
jgi:hypothetical protein